MSIDDRLREGLRRQRGTDFRSTPSRRSSIVERRRQAAAAGTRDSGWLRLFVAVLLACRSVGDRTAPRYARRAGLERGRQVSSAPGLSTFPRLAVTWRVDGWSVSASGAIEVMPPAIATRRADQRKQHHPLRRHRSRPICCWTTPAVSFLTPSSGGTAGRARESVVTFAVISDGAARDAPSSRSRGWRHEPPAQALAGRAHGGPAQLAPPAVPSTPDTQPPRAWHRRTRLPSSVPTTSPVPSSARSTARCSACRSAASPTAEIVRCSSSWRPSAHPRAHRCGRTRCSSHPCPASRTMPGSRRWRSASARCGARRHSRNGTLAAVAWSVLR